MTIAGIDPGKSGALAILYPDNSIEFHDVPRIMLRGKDKPAWNLWSDEWCRALENAAPDMMIIENVSSRPGQGVTSMFSFGRSLGFVHGFATAKLNCPIHFISPSVWKAKLGLLNSGKSASRERCRSLCPQAASSLLRVKDDGRAEAALLAYYGKMYLK